MAHKLHWTYLSKQIWFITISVQQDLFDQNNTKDKAEEATQSPDGWGRTKKPLRYSKSFTCKDLQVGECSLSTCIYIEKLLVWLSQRDTAVV